MARRISLRKLSSSRHRFKIKPDCLFRSLFAIIGVILLISLFRFHQNVSNQYSPPHSTNATMDMPMMRQRPAEPRQRSDLRPDLRQRTIVTVVEAAADTETSEVQEEQYEISWNNTIAYAISLTSCDNPHLTDGAAVLKHSIHLSSIHNPFSKSRYSYKMIAFVHPDAQHCSKPLQQFDYEVVLRDTPVNVSHIRNDWYRKRVQETGCCGEKEFIKLWSYTLDYPVVVHLDVDTLLLQPMDELFDAVIKGPEAVSGRIPLMSDTEQLPHRIDALFTRDYNMARKGSKKAGMQGGFFVVRPSRKVFEEYLEIILEGNFVQSKGWGGRGFGAYYGGQQIQGIMPYFYNRFHPNTAVNLNYCIFDNMATNPRKVYDWDQPPKPNEPEEECYTGGDVCEDCRFTNFTDIKLLHFTVCQKPWLCKYFDAENKFGEPWTDESFWYDGKERILCDRFHHEWFRIRRDLEKNSDGMRLKPNGHYQPHHFLGYCKEAGQEGYIPLKKSSKTKHHLAQKQ